MATGRLSNEMASVEAVVAVEGKTRFALSKIIKS